MDSVLLIFICMAIVSAIPLDKVPTKKCGIEASKRAIHRNPWTVFLEYYIDDEIVSTRCGGTLISDRYVVTAAHCIRLAGFDTLKVRLGEYNLTSKIDCSDDGVCAEEPISIEIEKISIHPHYERIINDIALLRLRHPAPYNDFIRPACLPSNITLDGNQHTFVASGWGEVLPGVYSDVKKMIPLPYHPYDYCVNIYINTALHGKLICAGGERGVDTCSGDSGGPLMLDVAGTQELWGVTSIGNPRCRVGGYPALYTRVADYLTWFEEIMFY